MAVRLARLGAASLIAVAQPFVAAAQAFEPSGKWVLDPSETHCLASRTFQARSGPVTLGIRQAPLGDTYELLVGRKAPPPPSAYEVKGVVNLGGERVRAWLLRSGSVTHQSEVYTARVTARQLQPAEAASALSIRVEDGPGFDFALDGLRDAMAMLATCTTELRQRWKIGSTAAAHLNSPARGDVRSLFSGEDYPAQAVIRRKVGSAQYLVLVERDGSVAGCHVIISSGVPVLDEKGCQVIRKRARFSPALDASGKPTRDSVVTPMVTWVVH